MKLILTILIFILLFVIYKKLIFELTLIFKLLYYNK